MSTDLMPFDYEGAELRTVVIDGEPWFVAADACRMLDLRDTSSALKMVDDADKTSLRRSDTPHYFEGIAPQVQMIALVNESGMYALIFQSNKDEARKVQRWITHDVLPAIRKTGSYGVKELTRSDLARMILAAEADLEAANAARVEAETHAKALEAPASAWKHMASSAGDYLVGDSAKILSRDPAITIGRDRLFAFMAAEGWIYRGKSKRGGWRAYQTQVECGRLVEKMASPFLNQTTGEMELPDPTIRVTAKGLAELHRRLGGTDPVDALAVAS